MRLPRSLACLLLALAPLPAAALSNQLADSPSAYLALHASDPVQWQVWGPDAIARARRENKPLYVSSGYFSCHWCHVMQRESYRNAEIAGLLNTAFIPVKVDRELNAALDAHLIEFVERTRGYSGWPLNVFVTPEGHPLIGMVYLPPTEFLALLQRLSSAWKEGAAQLTTMAAEAALAMQAPEPVAAPLKVGLGSALQEALRKAALGTADTISGGFGQQSKFPQVPQLQALLAVVAATGDAALREFLITTLDQMMKLGLHDLLGGGFFRYTVDPDWHTPHFEKMLYDNALLAALYLDAARVLAAPRYELQARRTLDFMLAELGTGRGALAASLSAVDDHDVEGGYYLWDNAALQELLSAQERKAVALAWGLAGQPALEAGHLPMQKMDVAELAQGLGVEEHRAGQLLDAARDKLLAARAGRRVPKDAKKLAAWNGLALIAFARAAQLPEGARYRAAGQAVRDYVTSALWDGSQLLRARENGRAVGNAVLEDYAYVAAGLLAWSELTGARADLALARQIAEQAWQRFFGERGWRLTEQTLLALGASEAVLADGPMPSPSGVLVETSLRLAGRTDAGALRDRALQALEFGHDLLRRDPFWYATHIRLIAAHDRDR